MQEEKTFSKTRRLVPLPFPLPQDHTRFYKITSKPFLRQAQDTELLWRQLFQTLNNSFSCKKR